MASEAQIEAAAKSLAVTVVCGSSETPPDAPRPGDGAPRWRNWETTARAVLEAVERAPPSGVNDIPDNVLLQRVLGSLRKRGRSREKLSLWSIVSDKFALGSTYASQLCRRFGLDPDEIVRR